jgi:HK97 family phage portal protein
METAGMTYNNVEQQNLHFLQYTLKPYLTRIEQRLNLLLSPKERKKLYFEFDTASILRGDAISRGEYYKTMHLSGIMTANEIRALENRAPIEGGDQLLSPVNMIPADMLGMRIGNANTANGIQGSKR